MKIKYLLVIFICIVGKIFSQIIPSFGNDIPVTINGLAFDAMEPALSADGNALFFNSLNDGITTSLYYAGKVNDSTFNFIGLVPIVNQTVTPRLDGVASLDSLNNFYWISTRDYPTNMDNLHRIRFLTTGYTNYGRVHGDFHIYLPGYIIMDASTSFDGNLMIYCNARFGGCVNNMPCEASMGIAQKINDSTFNKSPNTSVLMAAINDTVNYIVYAPHLSKDGLELYYTRLLKSGTKSEVMVSVRTNTNSAFGTPSVLVTSPSVLPEGPVLSSDMQKLYYHKKGGSVFKLFLKYRSATTDLLDISESPKINIFPNPFETTLNIDNKSGIENYKIEIHNSLGQIVYEDVMNNNIDLSFLSGGVFYISIINNHGVFVKKLMKL
jgi:hypothetical protein